MNRRDFVAFVTLGGVSTRLGLGAAAAPSHSTGWLKFAGNPVLGGEYGTCFDICVLRVDRGFRMWLSWRPKRSIAISDSADGVHWSAPEIVLGPDPSSGWEDDVNRPVVVHREGKFHMWYTGQISTKEPSGNGYGNGKSAIGYVTSNDGVYWTGRTRVLRPELAWEDVALMSPHVLWDSEQKLWRMWYSGGEQYEPNAIGHASSNDGIHWVKDPHNPVFRADANNLWERQRVAGAQILVHDGWFYIFYIGYRDIDHAQIGLARSRDGLSKWERCPANPIIRATGEGFDADACYKPYAVIANGKWMLWYNGRNRHFEQIGLATHDLGSLGFQG